VLLLLIAWAGLGWSPNSFKSHRQCRRRLRVLGDLASHPVPSIFANGTASRWAVAVDGLAAGMAVGTASRRRLVLGRRLRACSIRSTVLFQFGAVVALIPVIARFWATTPRRCWRSW